MRPANPIVVMGVAGSGKTVVGLALAARLERRFVDADDLHPSANVEKMRRGEPLNDDDRAPWLDTVGATLAESSAPIVACSALKRAYRDRLRSAAPGLWFVHLHGDRALISGRMAARQHHFMPLSLLDDQLATLELLDDDEHSVVVDIDRPIDAIVDDTLARLR